MKKTRSYYDSYKENVRTIFKKLSEGEDIDLNQFNNQTIMFFLQKLISLNNIPFFQYYTMSFFEDEKIKFSTTLPFNNEEKVNWKSVYELLYEQYI